MKKEKLHTNTDTMDLNISDLPEPIVHHIMSFLTTLDVTKLSILSKRFFSIWGSFPVIEFDQTRFARTSQGTPAAGDFLAHILNSLLLRRINTGLSEFWVKGNLEAISADRRFDLAISMVLANGVKSMVLNLGYADYRLPTDFASKSLEVLKLKGVQLNLGKLIQVCPLLKTVSLTSCVVLQDIKFSSKTLMELEVRFCGVKCINVDAENLHSFIFSSSKREAKPCHIDVLKCQKIKYFSLNNVVSNGHDWIEEHVCSLSALKTFILNGCQGIERIRVWNDKLERVEIAHCRMLSSVELMAASLESFAYESGGFLGMPCNITFSANSKHIKDLSIKGAPLITDQWLEAQLARMTLLERLRINACHSLTKIKVFLEKLQILELLDCYDLKEAEIDTPQLVSFMYHGNIIDVVKMVTQSNCTATLSMKPWTYYDNESFCRWRKLLSFFGHCKALKLICNDRKEVMIPELHRERLVSPLYDLKHLEIQIKSLEKIDRDLVDALLWLSPLPNTLLISYGDRARLQMIIKFVYSDMIEGGVDKNPFCCETKAIKCWKHHLKRLEIQSNDAAQKNGSIELQKYFLTNGKISDLLFSEGLN